LIATCAALPQRGAWAAIALHALHGSTAGMAQASGVLPSGSPAIAVASLVGAALAARA